MTSVCTLTGTTAPGTGWPRPAPPPAGSSTGPCTPRGVLAAYDPGTPLPTRLFVREPGGAVLRLRQWSVMAAADPRSHRRCRVAARPPSGSAASCCSHFDAADQRVRLGSYDMKEDRPVPPSHGGRGIWAASSSRGRCFLDLLARPAAIAPCYSDFLGRLLQGALGSQLGGRGRFPTDLIGRDRPTFTPLLHPRGSCVYLWPPASDVAICCGAAGAAWNWMFRACLVPGQPVPGPVEEARASSSAACAATCCRRRCDFTQLHKMLEPRRAGSWERASSRCTKVSRHASPPPAAGRSYWCGRKRPPRVPASR
jgi:hypothetical protein